jgi:hypothetical protein
MIPTFQVQFGVTTQVVRVYLDDRRNLGAVAKSSIEVTLTVTDNRDCGLREWRVDAQDLLVQLQRSNAALSGLFYILLQ